MDATKLTEGQLSASEKIFDDFRGQQCLPANEAYRDDVCKALDRAVLLDLLGLDRGILDSLAVLRDQWVCRTQCARRQIYQAGGLEWPDAHRVGKRAALPSPLRDARRSVVRVQ